MSKRILNELRRQLRVELRDNQESSDYKRGIKVAALIFSDILNDEGKTSLSDIMDSLSV